VHPLWSLANQLLQHDRLGVDILVWQCRAWLTTEIGSARVEHQVAAHRHGNVVADEEPPEALCPTVRQRQQTAPVGSRTHL
jgi:hypothetical protein